MFYVQGCGYSLEYSIILIPSTGKKATGKKAASPLSDVEEEDEDDANDVPNLEDEAEGEKENENLCNEGGTPVSKPKKQRKRKDRQAAVDGEANDKKKKNGEKSYEQGTVAFTYFRKIVSRKPGRIK